MRTITYFGLLAAITILACGDGSGPGPSDAPSIAGRYTGSIAPDNLASPSAPAVRVTVTQSGRSVSMRGSIGGSANNPQALFEASGTVDVGGVFTGTTGGAAEGFANTIYSSTCGSATVDSLTVRFSGGTATWDESATTAECGTVDYTGTLER